MTTASGKLLAAGLGLAGAAAITVVLMRPAPIPGPEAGTDTDDELGVPLSTEADVDDVMSEPDRIEAARRACTEALRAVPRPNAPAGYLPARRIVLNIERQVDRDLSDEVKDLTSEVLRTSLVLGRPFSPAVDCEAEIVDVYRPAPPAPTPLGPTSVNTFIPITTAASWPAVWPAAEPVPDDWTALGGACTWADCPHAVGDGSSTLMTLLGTPPPPPPHAPNITQANCPSPDPPTTSAAATTRAGDALPNVRQSVVVQKIPDADIVKALTIYPDSDRFFATDFGFLALGVRYSPGTSSPCVEGTSQVPDKVTVEIAVAGRHDMFDGLEPSFSQELAPGESIHLPVTTKMLFPMAGSGRYAAEVKDYTEDWLYGANVVITVKRGGRSIRRHEFTAYRYRDTSDASHRDGVVTLEPAVGDGPQGVQRKRALKIDVPKGAEVDFAIEDPASGFSTAARDGGPAIGTEIDWVFDPAPTVRRDRRVQKVQVTKRKSGRKIDMLLVAGYRVPKQVIDLKEADLVALLRDQLAPLKAPEHHLHPAILTPQERDHFTGAKAAGFASAVVRRVQDHYDQVRDGIEWGTPVDPSNHHWIQWGTRSNKAVPNSHLQWGERFPELQVYTGRDVGASGVTPNGSDLKEIDAIANGRDQFNWPLPELSFRIATHINRNMATLAEVWVDNILENPHFGLLNLTRDQAVQAIAKVTSHETGHALDQSHTAGLAFDGWSEVQQLVVPPGVVAYTVTFNGETTPPVQASTGAPGLQAAMRDLPTIHGPNVKVRRQSVTNGTTYHISFIRAFTFTDVPLIEARLHTGPAAALEVTLVTEGCGRGQFKRTFNEKLDSLIVMPPGASATTEKVVPCTNINGRAAGETAVDGNGAHDLMAGGWLDYWGRLQFLPRMTLAGLKIALHVNYTEQDMKNFVNMRLEHRRIGIDGDNFNEKNSPSARFWDDSNPRQSPLRRR